jgi:Leucine-rich repeat (LRR) protein
MNFSNNIINIVQGWQFVKNLRSLELCRGGDGVFFMPRGTYFEFPENTLTNLMKLGTEFFSFENPDAFKVLSNLVELELLHTKVGDIDAKRALFDLPNLVSLHWQNTQELNEQTLESMAKMTHLTKLFILEGDDYFEYYDTSFHGVNNMTHLKQLAIIDRADVSGLTNLEKLRLSHQAAKSIRSAEKLPKLVDLSLTDSSFYKEEPFILTTLCNMTNLTKLLFAVRLRGEENTRPFLLDNLSKLTNLRHLEIMPLENEDEPARCKYPKVISRSRKICKYFTSRTISLQMMFSIFRIVIIIGLPIIS